MKKILVLGLICLFFISVCKKPLPTSPDISEPEPDTSLSIEYFMANPTDIGPGDSSTLSWSTKNATKVEIDHGVGIVSAKETIVVSPEFTTTYTLTATKDDEVLTESASVVVNYPKARLDLTEASVSFSADYQKGVGRFGCSGWIENTGNAPAINVGVWVYIRDDEGIPVYPTWGGTFPVFERLEIGEKLRFCFYRESARLLNIVPFADKEQTIKYMKVVFDED